MARDLARGGQGRTCLDWHTGSILSLFAATVVLFAAWGAVEWASSTPLVDMRMMRIPAVWTTNAASLLFGFGMFAAFVLIPQFVQTPSRVGYGFGCAITQAGCFLVPIVVGMIIGGALTGPIAAAVGSKPSLAAGGVCSATAFGLLAAAHRHPYDIYRRAPPHRRHPAHPRPLQPHRTSPGIGRTPVGDPDLTCQRKLAGATTDKRVDCA